MARRKTRKPYRDGRVHVCLRMCATCVFRPGNLMQLNAGRLDNMIELATARNSAIICHETLDGKQSVCRGFFDQHKTQTLQIAERLGVISFTE